MYESEVLGIREKIELLNDSIVGLEESIKEFPLSELVPSFDPIINSLRNEIEFANKILGFINSETEIEVRNKLRFLNDLSDLYTNRKS